LERDTLVVAGVMAIAAFVLWPDRPERCLGVLGGVALIAISYRGILTAVAGLSASPGASLPAFPGAPPGAPATDWAHHRPDGPDEETSAESAQDPARNHRAGASGAFVKFFTRHAILALGAYVMMARFEFEPMAMLAGVTAPAVAAAVEIVRMMRARRSGIQPWTS
jgi:hypothetical protein